MQNPRPRKYASDAERQAAYRNRASMLEFRADEKTAEKLTEIADTLDISRSDLLLSMVKFALTNHQWARFGLTHKTLPRYEENPIMATKKFSVGDLVKFAPDVVKRTGGTSKNSRGIIVELDSRGYTASVDFQGTWRPNEETGSTVRMVPIANLTLATPKTNPATKKFSPAQIAAQKLFAERARAGTLGKTAKRKTNPDKAKPRAYVKRASQATGAPPSKRLVTRRKKALTAPAGYFPNPSTNIGLAIYLDAIAQGDTYSESKLVEALDHPALSTSDRAVIKAAIRGAPYNHTDLHHAAVKIRNYMGGQLKYSTAAVNKAIASSRSKISASEGKTIHRLLKGRHGNPAAAMMTGYQVICMHPKKHVVGVFKTMAEAKQIATAMANAKGVAYGVKAVKVHKAHFAA